MSQAVPCNHPDPPALVVVPIAREFVAKVGRAPVAGEARVAPVPWSRPAASRAAQGAVAFETLDVAAARGHFVARAAPDCLVPIIGSIKSALTRVRVGD